MPDTHTDVITAELNAIPALIKMNGVRPFNPYLFIDISMQAHPDQNDATVEYAYIDCQKDQLWFIVRFWAGAEMGHYFDLLHPIIQRREVIKPPRDLTILQLWGGGWRELITLEKASEQAGLLQSLLANPPPQPNGRGPTLEERYVVHPGTQLRFFKGTNLVAELVVPMLKPRTVPFVHTVSPI